MTEIIPGIYQLQLPLPGSYLEYVNVYLVKGNSGYLLVDAGWDTEEALNSLRQQLTKLHINLTEIHQIVVTHVHPDHCGLAGRLRQLSQAKVSLHHLDKNVIEPRYVNVNKFLQQMEHRLHINGVPPDELSRFQATLLGRRRLPAPALPDITFHGDETISTDSFSFNIVWTPGHSPGHICLYEPAQKILITGDHILPTITSNIGLNPQSSSNPLGDYLNSLNLVKQLEVNLVLPGHENPFTGLRKRVEELIRHHEQRKSEILGILKANPKTAYQICVEMTWLLDTYVNGVRGCDLDPLDKRMAVLETLAHLESMRVDGKVDKFLKDSIVFYHHT